MPPHGKEKKMKVKGLKKAIGDYKELNKGGSCNPHYGLLMFDYSDGELWTDEFYDLGHNSYKQYHSDTIFNLGAEMKFRGIEINMANVKEYIANNCEYWLENGHDF